MTRKVFLRLSRLLVVLLAGLLIFPAAVGAGYDQNNLMNDSLFDNISTMSASDIDTFLNRYPNSCISPNSGFEAKLPTGYSPSGGFTFGDFASAGQVIARAAQVYGINPQVLLVTLQKEQSLINGATCNSGSENKYAAAMGYGCPDSGGVYSYSGISLYRRNGVEHTSVPSTCVNSAAKAGFSQQVIRGAWLLKFGQQRSKGNVNWAVITGNWNNSDDLAICYSGPMTQGNRSRGGSCNQIVYYDGYTTIDSTSVHMDTGATAALYWYTPHFHGNQNFVKIFEDTFGFGDVHSGQLSIAHPDGTLVRPAAGLNAHHVYLLKDGGAAYATSLAVFQSWGFDFGKVKIATQGDLNLMAAHDADTAHTSTPRPLQFREGTLVKGSEPTVYVIQNVGGVNHKRSLDNLENFNRLGYSFSNVISATDSELSVILTDSPYTTSIAAHPNGTLIRSAGSPDVYYIINGEKHSMTSANIFSSHRFNWSQVVTATAGDNQLPTTWPVTWFGEGTLVKGSAPTVYVIDLDVSGVNQSKRNFVTYYNFVGLDYRFSEVVLVNDSELPNQNGTDIGG